MRKLLFLMTALSLALVSCDEPTPEGGGSQTGDNVALTLTSEGALIFNANGGFGTITYTLENGSASDIVVTTNQEEDNQWVINFNTSTPGEIGFSVKRNKTNFSRSCDVTVTCGNASFTVMVNQKSNTDIDETIEAPHLYGMYYGNRDGGDYNYYLILTDGELTDNGWGYEQGYGYFRQLSRNTPNAYYFTVDVYVTKADDGSLRVPDGEYELKFQGTGRGPIIEGGYSVYERTGADGWATESWNFEEGATLVVEGNRFEFVATLYDYENGIRGTRYFVTYEGDYTLFADHTGEIIE